MVDLAQPHTYFFTLRWGWTSGVRASLNKLAEAPPSGGYANLGIGEVSSGSAVLQHRVKGSSFMVLKPASAGKRLPSAKQSAEKLEIVDPSPAKVGSG
jgi:hypothetical protein